MKTNKATRISSTQARESAQRLEHIAAEFESSIANMVPGSVGRKMYAREYAAMAQACRDGAKALLEWRQR